MSFDTQEVSNLNWCHGVRKTDDDSNNLRRVVMDVQSEVDSGCDDWVGTSPDWKSIASQADLCVETRNQNNALLRLWLFGSENYFLALDHNEMAFLRSFVVQDFNKMTTLPDDLTNLNALQDLELIGLSSLISIPSQLGDLPHLRRLRISSCNKQAVFHFLHLVSPCTSVIEISLDDMLLTTTDLPHLWGSLNKFPALEHLCLENNMIEEVNMDVLEAKYPGTAIKMSMEGNPYRFDGKDYHDGMEEKE